MSDLPVLYDLLTILLEQPNVWTLDIGVEGMVCALCEFWSLRDVLSRQAQSIGNQLGKYAII